MTSWQIKLLEKIWRKGGLEYLMYVLRLVGNSKRKLRDEVALMFEIPVDMTLFSGDSRFSFILQSP